MIKPAFIFTDHAVLQRDKEVRIFGECDSKSLTVKYLDYTSEATVKDGKFTATLPPMPKCLTGTLSFVSECGEELSFNDVVTGDLWIAGGQSNMEHPTFCTHYEESDLTSDSQIRLFTVPRKPFVDANVLGWHFFAIESKDTDWQVYTKDSALTFCAVGAFFAKKLRAHTDVPIGIISCNWGATTAENWISREKLMESKYGRYSLEKYDELYGNINMAEYHAKFEQFQTELKTYLKTHESTVNMVKRIGVPFVLRNYQFSKTIPMGPYHYNAVSSYRMSMLERISGISARGVIWYQGESNVNQRGSETFECYLDIMKTLIADWRECFMDKELPFYIVQLSAFGTVTAESELWHTIRKAQQALADEDENVHTVVSYDVGEPDNIHPASKKPIGERLALSALANEYEVKIPWRSPKIKNVTRVEGGYELTFYDMASVNVKGKSIRGFFITDKDGKRSEAACIADGEKIIVSSPVEICSIAYASINYAVANVYNENGLPIFPFSVNL